MIGAEQRPQRNQGLRDDIMNRAGRLMDRIENEQRSGELLQVNNDRFIALNHS